MTTLKPGALFGHYRIDRTLGEGGMGVVYDAFDTRLHRQVALKMVHGFLADAQFLGLFQSEARILAQIKSPHIISIYDIGAAESGPFIVTQFIQGGDLTGLVRSRGPLAPHLACLVNAQVAGALHDAHQVGVIHQDVKPSNVLVKEPNSLVDPFALLCDFGIASSAAASGTAGSITGTWNYLAPEYARDDRDAHGNPIPPLPRRDVYAAGCMLWFTLTGNTPYAGDVTQVASDHQRAPIPQFAGTDEWSQAANRVLQLSMAKDPEARYQNAADFKEDLLKLREITSPDHIQPVPTPGNPNPSPIAVAATRPPAEGEAVTIEEEAKRSPVTAPRVIAAVAAVAVLGTAAGLGITRPWEEQGPEPIVPTVKGAAFADTNGDKFGDVVTNIGNPDGKGVDVVTWKSDGRNLTPSKPVTVTDPGLPSDVAADGAEVFPLVGDFKGTGENSMVTFHRSGDVLAFEGDLTGKVEAPEELKPLYKKLPDSTFYYDVGTADFDGDGVSDVFMSATFGNPDPDLDKKGRVIDKGFVFVYRGTKTGFDPAPTTFARFPAIPSEQMAVGDFSGDGKADLVVMNRVQGDPEDQTRTSGESTLDLYVGDGKAAAAAKPFPFEHSGIDAFLAGDVDGDGTDELVVVEYGRGGDRSDRAITVGEWDEGLAEFSYDHRGTLPVAKDLESWFPATLSDVNGDGLTDVVMASRRSASSPYQFYVAQARKKGPFNGHTMATWEQSPDNVHLYNIMGGTLQ